VETRIRASDTDSSHSDVSSAAATNTANGKIRRRAVASTHLTTIMMPRNAHTRRPLEVCDVDKGIVMMRKL
jgi:hypothetical protein